jgi:hypothetical protein
MYFHFGMNCFRENGDASDHLSYSPGPFRRYHAIAIGARIRPRLNARRGRASPAKISSCVLIFQAQVAAPAEPERRLDFAFGLRFVFVGRRSSRSELGQLNSRKHISPTPSLPPSPPLRPRPPLRRTTLVPRSHSPPRQPELHLPLQPEISSPRYGDLEIWHRAQASSSTSLHIRPRARSSKPIST